MDRSGVLIIVVGCAFLAAGGALVMLKSAPMQADARYEAGEQKASTEPKENSEVGEVAPVIEPLRPPEAQPVVSPTEPEAAENPAKGSAIGTGAVAAAGNGEENTALPIDSSNPQIVLAKMGPDFRRCYNRGLSTDPNMKGSLRVTARLAPDGKVVVANASGGNGLSKEVISCVVTRVKSAQFNPPAGGGATIVIPVNFVSQ